MKRNILFTNTAWSQYVEWQTVDKTVVKKINELIKDIMDNGLDKGIGKPEKLKYIDAYSRRITQADRLVYNLDVNDNLVIIACKYHYQD